MSNAEDCDDCLRMCDVLIRYKCNNDFKRISEYFTGRENKAGRTILRTDEDCRDGVYFIVWMNCCGFRLPENSRFELEFIPACELKPVVYKVSWVLDECGGYSPEVFLGLTGEKWEDYEDATSFLAWKLSLFSPEGKVISTKESFLWRHPLSPEKEPRLERKEHTGSTQPAEVEKALPVKSDTSDNKTLSIQPNQEASAANTRPSA